MYLKREMFKSQPGGDEEGTETGGGDTGNGGGEGN